MRRRIDEGVAAGIVVLLIADPQRATGAVVFVLTAHIVFRPFEIGQHVVVAPPVAAKPSPVVVIPPIAPDIDHRVDGARPAKPAPTRLIANPALQTFLRHRIVSIVGGIADKGHEPRRLDKHVIVARSCFQQAHALARFDQSPGNCTAAAAAADYDDVELIHSQGSSFIWRQGLGGFASPCNRVFR